jgi:hypothetical protein
MQIKRADLPLLLIADLDYRGGVNIRVFDKSQGLLSEVYFSTGKIRVDASFDARREQKKGDQADSNPLIPAARGQFKLLRL